MSLIPSRSQWHAWSLPSKLTAIGTFLAIASLGLYGLEKSVHVKDWIIDRMLESRYSKLPFVTVKIQNSTDKIINVQSEGEFVLWLPKGVYDGVQTIPGKYVISATSTKSIKDGLITIQPSGEALVVAQLMNPQYFSRILERGDTDLSFILRMDNGSSFFSDNIPFRREAIEKYFVKAEAGKKD